MLKRKGSERGAAIVEMAFVTPLLLLLILGIVEFGFVFGQYNEVRHAALEGSRVAAVSNANLDQDSDGDFDATDIELRTCSVLNLGSGTATVQLTQAGSAIGDTATITITRATPSLSGAPLVSSLVPASISYTATFLLEQDATWSAPATAATC
jgi:Flp pilus assembly protein TadG